MKCKICKEKLRKKTLCAVCNSDQDEDLLFSSLGIYYRNTTVQQQEISDSVSCFLILTDKRFVALDSYSQLNSQAFLKSMVTVAVIGNSSSVLIDVKLADIIEIEVESQRELFGKKESYTIITKKQQSYCIGSNSKAFYRRLSQLVKLDQSISASDQPTNLLSSAAVRLALNIAYKAHEKRKDKAGIPYIFHPFQIAQQMSDETAICVALLHDVLEDTEVTIEDLKKQGITAEVTAALKLLTQEKSESYDDYIQRIKDSGNVIAISVKLVDLRYNSDISRLAKVDKETSERIERYKLAIKILEMD